MFKRDQDFIGGVGILILCAVFFAATFQIRDSVSNLGAAFFPRLILGILAFLAVLLLVQGFRRKHEVESENSHSQEKEGNKRLLFTIIVIFFYVVALSILGFTISTALYLAAQFIILDEKQVWTKKKSALAGTIIAVGVYLTFTFVFQVQLPAGILNF